MHYEIVSINKLKPLEKVFPTHFKNLENMIEKDGFILKAIIADKKTGAIMDGSHRYVYFLKHGFKSVPVCWADYDDENVRVGTRLKQRFLIKSDTITKTECRKRALEGDLFPPRTTRHFFTFRKSDISLSLDRLDKGGPVDVSWLIADVDVSEEIEHNKKYIMEIDEEIEVIIRYLSEVIETKDYLNRHISLMDQYRQIAFFPGKFHPPHLGHIQTIQKISSKYKKVIVGVTGHMPEKDSVTTPDQIYLLLSSFFAGIKNIEVVYLKGTLVEKEDLSDLPQFDVLVSGNADVLAWAESRGVVSEYIERSEGFLCSGTEIRDLLKNEEHQ
jgi:cytidyltransferase-like protein